MIGRYLFKHPKVSAGLWWGYLALLNIRLGFAVGLEIISSHSFDSVKQLISKFGPIKILLSPLEIPVTLVMGIGMITVASTVGTGVMRLRKPQADQKAALLLAIGSEALLMFLLTILSQVMTKFADCGLCNEDKGSHDKVKRQVQLMPGSHLLEPPLSPSLSAEILEKRGLGSMIADKVSDTVSDAADKILDKVAENEHLKHLCSKLRLIQVFSILLAAVTGIILLVNLAEYAGARYDRKREKVQTAHALDVRTDNAAEQQHVQEEHHVGQGGNLTEGQRLESQPTGQNSDPSAFETLKGTFISR